MDSIDSSPSLSGASKKGAITIFRIEGIRKWDSTPHSFIHPPSALSSTSSSTRASHWLNPTRSQKASHSLDTETCRSAFLSRCRTEHKWMVLEGQQKIMSIRSTNIIWRVCFYSDFHQKHNNKESHWWNRRLNLVFLYTWHTK